MTAVGRSMLFPVAVLLFTLAARCPANAPGCHYSPPTRQKVSWAPYAFPALPAAFLTFWGHRLRYSCGHIGLFGIFIPLHTQRSACVSSAISGHAKESMQSTPASADGYSARETIRILAGLAKDRSKGFSLSTWMPGAARAYGRGYPINAAVLPLACLRSWKCRSRVS